MKIRNLLLLACFGLLLVAPTAFATEAAPAEMPADVEAAPVAPDAAPLALEIPEAEEKQPGGCIQVIVWARNPGSGECKQYPTPCDVPSGWDYYFTQAECEAAAS
ncbi:MAG TPA: hypothetical protein VHQ65_06865 [Thermoanaerobaculia bacterium]|nr:hypothetical protein [Thermoanaerobaculia bacterium]